MNNQSNIYYCHLCDNKFDTKIKHRTHLKNHLIKRCDIESCNYMATTRKNLIHHLKTKHNNIYGRNGYDKNNFFDKYMILTKDCDAITRRTCILCKDMVYLKKMKNHLQNHILKNDIKCKDCNDTVSYSYINYLNHKKKHMYEKFSADILEQKIDKNKLVRCEICYVYISRKSIRKHLKNHETSDFKCIYCKNNIMYKFNDFVFHFINEHALYKIKSFINKFITQEELLILYNIESNSNNTELFDQKINELNILLNEIGSINSILSERGLVIGKLMYDIFADRQKINIDNKQFIHNINIQSIICNNILYNTKSNLSNFITVFKNIINIIILNKDIYLN